MWRRARPARPRTRSRRRPGHAGRRSPASGARSRPRDSFSGRRTRSRLRPTWSATCWRVRGCPSCSPYRRLRITESRGAGVPSASLSSSASARYSATSGAWSTSAAPYCGLQLPAPVRGGTVLAGVGPFQFPGGVHTRLDAPGQPHLVLRGEQWGRCDLGQVLARQIGFVPGLRHPAPRTCGTGDGTAALSGIRRGGSCRRRHGSGLRLCRSLALFRTSSACRYPGGRPRRAGPGGGRPAAPRQRRFGQPRPRRFSCRTRVRAPRMFRDPLRTAARGPSETRVFDIAAGSLDPATHPDDQPSRTGGKETP